MQIISLQDGTRLAKWNSYQIAASAWPLKAKNKIPTPITSAITSNGVSNFASFRRSISRWLVRSLVMTAPEPIALLTRLVLDLTTDMRSAFLTQPCSAFPRVLPRQCCY